MCENEEIFLMEQKQTKILETPEKAEFAKVFEDGLDKNGTVKNDDFEFKIPQEAPVFVPTVEEFKNPLAYISKIRQKAEKYGICKIKPPSTWQPPFTVDVDKLRFTPRVQRLNELEAKTRIKLNFLDQIAKFWELQGSSLKIPMVERKALDLYSLHRIVQEEGGIEVTTRERKWSKIASRMGYPNGKNIGTNLKSHYERILYPYDVFTTGKVVELKVETEMDAEDHDYKPHSIAARQALKPPTETTARRSKRFAVQTSPTNDKVDMKLEKGKCEDDDDIKSGNEFSRERRKLQIHGAGPRMPGVKLTKTPDAGNKSLSRSNSLTPGNENKSRNKTNDDPLAKYICHICTSGDVEEAMLLCDGCDDSYHTFCLMPPLVEIPKGEWRCPKCVVEEVSKPVEAFGFEQAQREYTLQQFGEMADQFKSDYFNMPVHLVPTELVEKEFWRIVSSIDEDVTVEYGADLHTMDHGSGFPTKSSLYLLPGDQEYAESSWNLNNLPVLEESILGHINADISGMKVPWMYVGMCFATFCWHNEDHWSYSINYLHWGEPKTWYGVPGNKAEAFENTMKSAAPELFESQPDLLHQLVTIMNPNILMAAGVPVCRTDQHAGEFIITFPRAYHAGFNQGYNFAEAVNFAPADWLKMGRECINHYSLLRRFCVFSHDELVCKMALEPDKLISGIATACYLDMAEMVDCEKKLRKSLLEWGVTKAEREAFELLPDDERQCEVCKTTCFLSAVTCTCSSYLTCLRHYTALCQCLPEKHTLKYRYTLDELPLMLRKLKVKAESFENWLTIVRNVLDPNTPTTITLDDLQDLAQEADEKRFPSSVLLERLNSAVLEAEKCVTVIQQLDINKIRTRTRNSNSETTKYKLTMDELDMFVQEIDNLCCIIQEGNSVRELQQMGHEFVRKAEHILVETNLNQLDVVEMAKCIEIGASLCIELPQIVMLRDRKKQAQWYQMCAQVRDFNENNKHPTLAQLKKIFEEGMVLTPYPSVEKELAEIQNIVAQTEEWEICAKQCFENGTQHQLPEIEALIERADLIFCVLPSLPQLRDALKKSKEWLTTVEILQSNENYPYFNTLENVVARGKNIPFQLEELKRMDEYLDAGRCWKERTCRTFLKKNTLFTLMDALSPRSDAIMIPSRQQKKLSGEKVAEKFTEDLGPVQMVVAFKQAEEKEMQDMRHLRDLNGKKNPEQDSYCVCKRNFSGVMYNCQLCKDWFHATCVPPPKNTVRQRPPGAVIEQPSFVLPSVIGKKDREEEKYLCPSCMRSRRPRLETILSLLVSLQRLPLRLPEGEALQCLTERAMNWQDRARQALSSDDVASALARLSMISQKNTDSDGMPPKPGKSTSLDARNKSQAQLLHKHKKRKKRNGPNSPEPDRPVGNASETQKLKSLFNTITSSDSNYNTEEDEGCERVQNKPDFESSNSSQSPNANAAEFKYATTTTTTLNTSQSNSPSYSAPSIIIDDDSLVAGSLIASPSKPCNPKIEQEPLITLNNETKSFLENLMMEGDLLEVSLDETQHLWRILNAAKATTSALAYIQKKYSIVNPSVNEPLLVKSSAMKKRKNDESMCSSSAAVTTANRDDLKQLSDANILTPLNINTTSSTKTTEEDDSVSSPSPKPKQRMKRGRKIRSNCESSDFLFDRNQLGGDILMGLSTSAANLTASMSRKRNVNSNVKGRRNLSNLKKIQQNRSTAAETTSDDEDECSATNCAKPTGTEVDWVQCDGGCNKWFHMHCVGLKKSQIKPDDDFICRNCRKGEKSTTVTSEIGVTEFADAMLDHNAVFTNEAPNENEPITVNDKEVKPI